MLMEDISVQFRCNAFCWSWYQDNSGFREVLENVCFPVFPAFPVKPSRSGIFFMESFNYESICVIYL